MGCTMNAVRAQGSLKEMWDLFWSNLVVFMLCAQPEEPTQDFDVACVFSYGSKSTSQNVPARCVSLLVFRMITKLHTVHHESMKCGVDCFRHGLISCASFIARWSVLSSSSFSNHSLNHSLSLPSTLYNHRTHLKAWVPSSTRMVAPSTQQTSPTRWCRLNLFDDVETTASTVTYWFCVVWALCVPMHTSSACSSAGGGIITS